jgi:heterodisulfide reductase subunit A-like polyferredoxin
VERVGVFICHCGSNIGAVVDCARVAEAVKDYPGVAYSTDYKYMCSEPGQEMIQNAIKEHNLNRVVVASCSPRMHEKTFRACVEKVGMNPYMFEMANIREHCSWVHAGKNEEATEKAIEDRLSHFSPHKKFYTASPKLLCEDMKKITFEKIYNTLLNEHGEIILEHEVAEKASVALKRMMEVNA